MTEGEEGELNGPNFIILCPVRKIIKILYQDNSRGNLKIMLLVQNSNVTNKSFF